MDFVPLSYQILLLKTRPLAFWKRLSADLFSVMAYGISDSIQENYSSPRDLKQKAIFNFHKQNFWYAVAFPEWGGYRIEHDPVYTGYTSFSKPILVIDTPAPDEKKEDESVCGSTMIVLLATTASVTVIGYRRKKRWVFGQISMCSV